MKRLIRKAQQTTSLNNQTIDPYDSAMTALVNKTAKAMEQGFYQGMNKDIHMQDLIPYGTHNTFQTYTGMDLNNYVNANELVRLIGQELGRDQKIYQVIQKYLLNKFRIYVNQHNQQVQQNQSTQNQV